MTQPTLKETAEYFIEVAQAAVANHRKSPGGQQAQYFDDFAYITPSVAKNLEWWAERFKLALEQSKCQRETCNSACKISKKQKPDNV